MQIEFQCSCGKRMRTASENRGKKTRCTKCGETVLIEASSIIASPQAPSQNQTRALVTAKPVDSQHAQDPSSNEIFPDFASPLPSNNSTNYVQARTIGNSSIQQTGKQTTQHLSNWLWIGIGLGTAALLLMIGLGVAIYYVTALPSNDSGVAFNTPSTDAATDLPNQDQASSIPNSEVVGNANMATPPINETPSPPFADPFASPNGAQPTSSLVAPVVSPQTNTPVVPAEPQNVTPPKAAPLNVEEKTKQVSQRFAKAISEGDFATCGQLFSQELFVANLSAKTTVSDQARGTLDSLKDQFRALWERWHTLASLPGGAYEFVHLVNRSGDTRGLIRFQSATGWDYHELVIQNNASNELVISDIFVLSRGETFTESTQQALYAMDFIQGRSNSNVQLNEVDATVLSRISLMTDVDPQATWFFSPAAF